MSIPEYLNRIGFRQWNCSIKGTLVRRIVIDLPRQVKRRFHGMNESHYERTIFAHSKAQFLVSCIEFLYCCAAESGFLAIRDRVRGTGLSPECTSSQWKQIDSFLGASHEGN